ncbi:MAG: hypothetical protein V1690_03610 [Candidatus Moraniibacteriota bacterium]
MSAAKARVLDITTGKEMVPDSSTETSTQKTRKEKQAEKKRAQEAAERAFILAEAAKTSKPANERERLVLAKAFLFKCEDKLAVLDQDMGKIVQFLGGFNSEEDLDKYVEWFTKSFLEHEYRCAVKGCESRAEWVFSLNNSLRRSAKLKGLVDFRVPWKHAEQWEMAVGQFRQSEDLEGIVVCESCKGPLTKKLEEAHPKDDTRNHQFYHLKGFVPQIARNRHRMMREDLVALEVEILEMMDLIEEGKKKISLLEEEVKKADEKDQAMKDLISFD